MEDRKGQKCSHAREKGRSDELRAVRSWLMWMACFPPGAMEMSGPGSLPMVMSGFTVLTTVEVCVGAGGSPYQGSCSCLESGLPPMTMLWLKECAPTRGSSHSKEPVLPHRPMGTSGPVLLSRVIYGSVAL